LSTGFRDCIFDFDAPRDKNLYDAMINLDDFELERCTVKYRGGAVALSTREGHRIIFKHCSFEIELQKVPLPPANALLLALLRSPDLNHIDLRI
jgi:hypothetical protein